MSELKRPNLLLHLALSRRQPPGSLLTSFSN
jgi:hypothetical protein